MKNSGKVRIIGGRWKRRVIRFPNMTDLRPSPDVVRETLFNWLMGMIEGKNCLDLYSGSGAIGFEAASRGAHSVVMVEANIEAARQLQYNCNELDASDHVSVVHGDVLEFLDATECQFDLVFMDPPFGSSLIDKTCESLVRNQRIRKNGLVYIESPFSKLPLLIPPSWNIIRQSQKGMVQSTLLNTEQPNYG